MKKFNIINYNTSNKKTELNDEKYNNYSNYKLEFFLNLKKIKIKRRNNFKFKNIIEFKNSIFFNFFSLFELKKYNYYYIVKEK